jgi:hypothetical protein
VAAKFTPGSPGLGDPYFPREGNGGYDATHYDLDLTYLPDDHHLEGTVTINAIATQNLSRFDLDFKNNDPVIPLEAALASLFVHGALSIGLVVWQVRRAQRSGVGGTS